MAKSKRPRIEPSEQEILDQVRLVLLSDPADVARAKGLIEAHHYLHDATVVGENLHYALSLGEQWMAVASWGAPARHLKDRDQFIGWSHEQCRRRRALLANNTRLLVLPECHCPNLISRFMKLMLGQLSADWQARWGHPIALVETFVDPKFHQATAYKASGWRRLGLTAGWKRDAEDFYLKHDSPKQIWVRDLVPKARPQLSAPQLPEAWANVEADVPPRCSYHVPEILSLMDLLRGTVTEFRRPQSLGDPLPGLLCLIVMAMATGVRQSPADLADYADTLSQGQLRALGFRRDAHTRDYRAPKKTTFHRVLEKVDAKALEATLLRWQEQLLGPTQNPVVIVDGKKVRHGGGEIVNLVDGQGRFLGSARTPDKTNEIPIARELLRRVDLAGKIVLADALHTNEETAHQIVFDQGGDYLLTVKRNQPALYKTLQKLFEKQPFSPRPTAKTRAFKREHNCGRCEIRLLDCLEVIPEQVSFPGARLAAQRPSTIPRASSSASVPPEAATNACKRSF